MTGQALDQTRNTTSDVAGAQARQRLLAGLAVKERHLDVAGVSTAVLEAGDGAPLVLLHGGIECGGIYWAPVIARLGQSHRLVIPDVPGLGESGPVTRLETAALDGWLAAVLRLTGAEKPALVAHSLLGSLAARFAAQRSGLLRQLVVYGAPGLGRYRMPLGLMAAAIRSDLWPSERNTARFERWVFYDLDQTRQRDPEWFGAFNRYMLSRAVVPHVKRTMRRLLQAGTRQVPDAELRRIGAPTRLLWGRHDRMAPLRLAEIAGARLGWPLQVVEDAGHAPHIEQPEAFVRALQAALA
ncbi:MAG: alpha/beta hydrolase [Anaerolineales bacterium]|nr:alpha/beta hydrolase [Anaerolineales bacterium]